MQSNFTESSGFESPAESSPSSSESGGFEGSSDNGSSGSSESGGFDGGSSSSSSGDSGGGDGGGGDGNIGGDEPVEVKVNPVQIVTIKNKIPLFKGEEQANSIEKIEIEENGFSLVSQKDLYQIGDKAVYIQPDYSLSDISLFDSFIRPFGDPKKSKLGSNYRIRAVKFNLHTGDLEPTYSVGILLPLNEVNEYLNSIKWPVTDLDLSKALGITKWEEPDNNGTGGLKVNGGKQYPSGVYKTDETNCFEENQLIFTDKGMIKIKDVCENINNFKVLSFNHDEMIEEFKEIDDFQIKNNNNDWYKITTEDDDEIILTSEHPVFLPILNCYRQVKELTDNDFIYKTEL